MAWTIKNKQLKGTEDMDEFVHVKNNKKMLRYMSKLVVSHDPYSKTGH